MNNTTDLRIVRFGLFTGLLFYALFGILDYFMLPLNYRSAWFIRYVIVIPAAILCLIATYIPALQKLRKQIGFAFLIVGQLGILTMIVIADPAEPAFYGYYVGCILVLLTCEFLFQISMRPSIIFFILSVVFYLLIAAFDQQMLTGDTYSFDQRWLIGNFFFFVSAGIISLLGLARLHHSRYEADNANLVKTSFLANISHEIRTPLNGITGCARLLAEAGTSEVNRKRFKDIIDYSSRQLLDIVDSILLMSEIETGKSEIYPEQISLIKTFEDLQKQFTFIAEQKNLEFVNDCWITLEQDIFLTDLQKFRMIINNLLNNAIKFTNEGSITLKSGFMSEGLRIIVEDTGIGISPEHLEKIFESFYQTDKGYSREFGGNGLGLSICRSYISMLQGSIDVQSTVGKGTRFILTLPSIQK